MPRKSTPAEHDRRMRGFERADGLLTGRIRRASEGRGFAVSRLLTHWAEVAGDQLARATRPVRITYGRGGFGATLVLLVKGAEAPMIQAQLPGLKDRVNAVYGYRAVSRIQLTQTAPTGFAEGQADFDHGPARKEQNGPNPRAEAESRDMARDVADPDLRLALSRMGAHILTKSDERKV